MLTPCFGISANWGTGSSAHALRCVINYYVDSEVITAVIILGCNAVYSGIISETSAWLLALFSLQT
jgi:hypothetical protein